MPAQDRVGGDQTMTTQRSGQPPDERGEDRPVRPIHARSRAGVKPPEVQMQEVHNYLTAG